MRVTLHASYICYYKGGFFTKCKKKNSEQACKRFFPLKIIGKVLHVCMGLR